MAAEFGPNQEQVDALLARLDFLNQEEAMFLASFDSDDSQRRRARDAMRRAAVTGGRGKELEAAQRKVEAWVDRWFAGGSQVSGYGRDVTPAEAAARAAPPVLDAVGALVVGDLLPPDTFEVLTLPWRELGQKATQTLGAPSTPGRTLPKK